MDYIDQMEKEGKIFVIAPSKTPNVSRLEHNKLKIMQLYNLGKQDTADCYDKMREFINK